MGWTDTGFRRTLKLRIIRTEKNNMEEEKTFDYDGKNLGDYVKGESNWTDEQLAQAPLTGDSSFNNRVAAFRSYIEGEQPLAATSGITWANTRVGAKIYCQATFDASNEKITFSLYTDNDCKNSTTAKQDIEVIYNLYQQNDNKTIATYAKATISAGNISSGPIAFHDSIDNITVDTEPIYNVSYGEFVYTVVYGKMATSITGDTPMYVIENVDKVPFIK
jgi:hypothetical protein